MKFKASIAILLCSLAGAAADCAAQTPPLKLTLAEAMERGLQANLGVLLAGASTQEAEAARLRALSATKLPRLTSEVYANLHSTDLRAQGLSFHGLPEVVGPLANYDFRVSAQQDVIDVQGRRTLDAADRAIDAGKLTERDARDTVERSVAAYYLNAESFAARKRSAESSVNDAERLLKLARDRHDAGAATGVDVLRAEVELANQKQVLLATENRWQIALLELARLIGIKPTTPIELSESLEFHPEPETDRAALIESALAARADYLALAAERRQLEAQQAASRARYYPKFSLGGNVGEIGRTFGQMRVTGAIQGQLDFTLFDRDREGEAEVLAARVRRIDAQIDDLRRGIEQEIGEALLTIDSASQQVAVAEQGEMLARRELEMARDRFETGTANNVEVVTAQDELTRAEENTILAITAHTDAHFALVRAMGTAAKNLSGAPAK